MAVGNQNILSIFNFGHSKNKKYSVYFTAGDLKMKYTEYLTIKGFSLVGLISNFPARSQCYLPSLAT